MLSPIKTLSVICLVLAIILSVFSIMLFGVFHSLLQHTVHMSWNDFIALIIVIPVPAIFFLLAFILRKIDKVLERDASYLAETVSRLEKEIKELKQN